MRYMMAVCDNDDTYLYNENGAYAAFRVEKENLRLLRFYVPQEDAATADDLLYVVETRTFLSGKKKLICDFPKENGFLAGLFDRSGYETVTGHSVISVGINELLSSAGVHKSLRMKPRGMESIAFEDLFLFQEEEVQGFLRGLHYPFETEHFKELNKTVSAITYDASYNLSAVILASPFKDDILVELLLGSSKNPQYVLSVCQKFVSALMKDEIKSRYSRIRFLTVNDAIIPLIRRLLDKQYEIKTDDVILHAEKKVEAAAADIVEANSNPVKLFGRDTDLIQYNTNAKYIWTAEKKKG